MKKESIAKIDEVIRILKTNPKIEMVGDFENIGPCQIGIAYPDYPGWVYDVEKMFEPVTNYDSVIKTIKKQKKTIDEYNMVEIRAALTYFVRWEKFCDGHMASMIEGGYLLQWLTRYKQLLVEEINDD